MALSQGTLGFPTVVSNNSTSTIYTVASSKKVYIRSIVIYNANYDTSNDGLSQTVQIHMVANGGSVSATTRIARVTLVPDDTFFFEPQYPITMVDDGDTIRVTNEGTSTGSANNSVNVLILGDVEA